MKPKEESKKIIQVCKGVYIYGINYDASNDWKPYFSFTTRPDKAAGWSPEILVRKFLEVVNDSTIPTIFKELDIRTLPAPATTNEF